MYSAALIWQNGYVIQQGPPSIFGMEWRKLKKNQGTNIQFAQFRNIHTEHCLKCRKNGPYIFHTVCRPHIVCIQAKQVK